MLRKDATSTIFWVFGMTPPGIELRSPGSLANTIYIYIYAHMCIHICICVYMIYRLTHTHTHTHTYIYIYIYIYRLFLQNALHMWSSRGLGLFVSYLLTKSLSRLCTVLSRLRWEPCSPPDLPFCPSKKIFYQYFNKTWWYINSNVSVMLTMKVGLSIGWKFESSSTFHENSQAQDSAIGDHWSEHFIFWTNYSDDRFSVLHKTRCKKLLIVLKAIAIMLFHPSLCRQRRQFYHSIRGVWLEFE